MANLGSDCFKDAFSDMLNEKVEISDDDSTKQLEEEFYDACSLGDHEVHATECGDGAFDAPDDWDAKQDNKIIDDEPTESRLEIENKLSDEELDKRKCEAILLKEDGNIAFKQAEFDRALRLYTEAIALCPLRFSDELAKMFSNRATCHSKLDSREAALGDCDEALRLNPDFLRCLVRRAELRESAERFTEALEDYQHIVNLDPDNAKARVACAMLPAKIEAQQENMKAEMIGQLKQLGDMVLKPFGLSTDNFKCTQDPNTGGYSINFDRCAKS